MLCGVTEKEGMREKKIKREISGDERRKVAKGGMERKNK